MDDTGRDSISLLIRHNLGHGFPSSAPKSVFRLLNEWPHFPSSSNSSPRAAGRGVQVSNGNLSFFPVLVHLHIVTRASGGLVAWGEGGMQGGRTERANLCHFRTVLSELFPRLAGLAACREFCVFWSQHLPGTELGFGRPCSDPAHLWPCCACRTLQQPRCKLLGHHSQCSPASSRFCPEQLSQVSISTTMRAAEKLGTKLGKSVSQRSRVRCAAVPSSCRRCQPGLGCAAAF